MSDLDQLLRRELLARAADVVAPVPPTRIRARSRQLAARRRRLLVAGSAFAAAVAVAGGAVLADTVGQARRVSVATQPATAIPNGTGSSGAANLTPPAPARMVVGGATIPFRPTWLPAGATETGRWAYLRTAGWTYGAYMAEVRSDTLRFPKSTDVAVGGKPGHGWTVGDQYQLAWAWRDGLWGKVIVPAGPAAVATAVRIAESFVPVAPVPVTLPFAVPGTVLTRSIGQDESWGTYARAGLTRATVTLSTRTLSAVLTCDVCTSLTIAGHPARYGRNVDQGRAVDGWVVVDLGPAGYLTVRDVSQNGEPTGQEQLAAIAGSVRITGSLRAAPASGAAATVTPR